MKNIKSLYVLGLFAIVVLLSSCLSTIVLEDDEIVKENETKIQTYLSSQSLSFTKATNGIYYAVTAGDTSGRKSLATADTVRVQYVISRLDGFKLDSSTQTKPFEFLYGGSTSIFVKILPLIRESQKATFIIPSTQALGTQTFPNLPANSPIKIDVSWFKAYSENADIDRYVLAQKLTLTGNYSNGLRYIRTQEGTGDYMASGKIAKVKYTGKFLNGKIFDSNVSTSDSLSVTIGASSGLVTGFQRGIELMKVGEKATLIFPSSIGYSTTGKGTIPGETPLIFDVQVVAVSDN